MAAVFIASEFGGNCGFAHASSAFNEQSRFSLRCVLPVKKRFIYLSPEHIFYLLFPEIRTFYFRDYPEIRTFYMRHYTEIRTFYFRDYPEIRTF